MDYLNTKSCLSPKLSLKIFTQIFLLLNHLKHNEDVEIKFFMHKNNASYLTNYQSFKQDKQKQIKHS